MWRVPLAHDLPPSHSHRACLAYSSRSPTPTVCCGLLTSCHLNPCPDRSRPIRFGFGRLSFIIELDRTISADSALFWVESGESAPSSFFSSGGQNSNRIVFLSSQIPDRVVFRSGWTRIPPLYHSRPLHRSSPPPSFCICPLQVTPPHGHHPSLRSYVATWAQPP